MLSNTEIADIDISGPIPSPVINDILYIILQHTKDDFRI
jgi:hypothetical protein